MREQYQMEEVSRIFALPEKYEGREVTVGGWIKSNRDSKNIGFIALDDGTCFRNLQLVYSADLPNFAEVAKLNISSAIIATGKIVLTPQAKQPLEMQVTKIEVEGVHAGLSAAEEETYAGIPSYNPASARPDQYI